jgi:SpoVK/Ycf46/Vps4 family AAA+-type ATPase
VRAVFAAAHDFVSVPLPTGRPPLCVIFLDEVDALCKARDPGAPRSPVQSRVIAQLLTLMDGLASRAGQRPGHGFVVVIAATNLPHEVDLSFRRAGRFDREVVLVEFEALCWIAPRFFLCVPWLYPQIGVNPPSPSARLDILQLYCSRLPLEGGVRAWLSLLAPRLVGYVGADIAALCREAALLVASEERPDGRVGIRHFEEAVARLGPPSALRGITPADVPSTTWDDVGGLSSAKLQLQQAVEWPLRYPEAFRRMGLAPPRGVLLFGPPGCAKTTLVRAAAVATGAAFIVLSGADVYSPYVGDAEKAVRKAFRLARSAPPAIVFLDEVDAIVGKRGIGSTAEGQGGWACYRLLWAGVCAPY